MRCTSCLVVNDEGNHFCAHCGLAFPNECTVCFCVTATYLHCGHPLCFACRSRIPKKECPVCSSAFGAFGASASASASAASELTLLLADLRMFRCDLVCALYYRCTARRFCVYDARHLVAPILEAELWMSKARRLIRGWDKLVAQAHEDAVATSSLRNGTLRTDRTDRTARTERREAIGAGGPRATDQRLDTGAVEGSAAVEGPAAVEAPWAVDHIPTRAQRAPRANGHAAGIVGHDTGAAGAPTTPTVPAVSTVTQGLRAHRGPQGPQGPQAPETPAAPIAWERDMLNDQAIFLMSRLKTESLTWPRLVD